ncbi:MAG: GSU2403 family nucleotidyltransferase fold protein [Methylotenera sp.]
MLIPLEFLDYLIKDPVEAAVLYGAGILVNVPDPAKYAMHKLAVSQLHPVSMPEKKRKDLMQAEALIEYLLDQNPGSLLLATDEVRARGRGDMLHSFVSKGIHNCKNQELIRRFNMECWQVQTARPGFN